MTNNQFSIHLIVNDLSESLNFYTDILNFKLVNLRGEPPFFAQLSSDSMHVHLSEVGARGDSLLKKSKGIGVKFQIEHSNVDKLYKHVKTHLPFKITQELSDFDFGWRLFSVTDFDGYEWSFYEILKSTP